MLHSCGLYLSFVRVYRALCCNNYVGVFGVCCCALSARYTAMSLPVETEIGVVVAGAGTNILIMLWLMGVARFCQNVLGSLPDAASRC